MQKGVREREEERERENGAKNAAKYICAKRTRTASDMQLRQLSD